MALPTLAVHKFASCDGCQLSLLDLEDELLAVAGVVQIANFMEASREVLPPPYDVTLVEGSITTAHDAERIKQIREETPVLITIGACATAGGIQALRNAFYTFEDFSLETVAGELLGRGKDIAAKGEEKIAEIERRFREDKGALALYNLEDCRLVSEIFEHTAILAMMLTRTEVSGMLLDMLGRSVGAFEHIYLPRLHRAGLVAPDLDDIPQGQHAAGGLVFTPDPGIHDHVVVLDFKSLYPSLIRTFKIDPLARLRHETDPIRTPVGIEFSATEHILPAYITQMMELRDEAKRTGNAPLSQAIKILMNSFYGVMGSPGCRLYHYDLPSAITGTGQWLLRRTREVIATVVFAGFDLRCPPHEGLARADGSDDSHAADDEVPTLGHDDPHRGLPSGALEGPARSIEPIQTACVRPDPQILQAVLVDHPDRVAGNRPGV